MADISKITTLDGTTYNIKALRSNAIPISDVDSTSTSTAFTIQVPEFNNETGPRDGLFFYLHNPVVASAEGYTLNVNSWGAKPVYTPSSTRSATGIQLNRWHLMCYSSTLVSGGCWIVTQLTDTDTNTNTIGYLLRTNNSTRPAADKGYRYRLWFSSADNTKWVPANLSSSTNATASRTPNTRPINPFGRIIYYSTNGSTDAGSNLSATTSWQQNVFALGYSFNTTGSALTLTYPAPVYIKCIPQSDGSAVLSGYVQALPSTEDGYIYIYLGQAYSATNVELMMDHPVYWYNDGKIRPYTLASTSSSNLIFTNTTVAASAFEYDGTYSPYDYKATVALTGVTSNMIPFVSYSISDVEEENFAPSAESYNGGIYLYSNRVPSSAITIPTILVVS